MARLIDKEIRRRLADEVLFGELQDGGEVQVGADAKGLTFAFEARSKPADEKAEKAAEVSG